MAGSVEDYLAFCDKRGEPPKTRIPAVRGPRGADPASGDRGGGETSGLSLNKWVARLLARETA